MTAPAYKICACIECGAWPVKPEETGRFGVCPEGHRVLIYVNEEQYVAAFKGKTAQCQEPSCDRPVEAAGFKRCRICIQLGAKKKRARR